MDLSKTHWYVCVNYYQCAWPFFLLCLFMFLYLFCVEEPVNIDTSTDPGADPGHAGENISLG